MNDSTEIVSEYTVKARWFGKDYYQANGVKPGEFYSVLLSTHNSAVMQCSVNDGL